MTTEVEENFELIVDKEELEEEPVQQLEVEVPQIIDIDESITVKHPHRTTHQDFDSWISTVSHKQEKSVVIEQFGTPELLS